MSDYEQTIARAKAGQYRMLEHLEGPDFAATVMRHLDPTVVLTCLPEIRDAFHLAAAYGFEIYQHGHFGPLPSRSFFADMVLAIAELDFIAGELGGVPRLPPRLRETYHAAVVAAFSDPYGGLTPSTWRLQKLIAAAPVLDVNFHGQSKR